MVTMPGLLRENGFETSGFVAALPLIRAYGFANGFDHFDDALEGSRGGHEYAERSAQRVVDAALSWIDSAPASRLFVWVHFFDVHHPRRVHPALVRLPARDDYEREIRGLDLQLDRLLREIEIRRGKPIVAIASDHGEGLGDHGESSHGVLLYQELLHAIFGISAPEGSAEAQRLREGLVPEIVRFVDVLPTLFATLGLSAPDGAPGRSLLDPPPATLAAYGESYYSTIHFGWSPILSLRTQDWTYIHAPEAELFDRSMDPGEKRNVLGANADVAHALAARLEAMIVEPAAWTGSEGEEGVDDQLASLGYVAGTSGGKANRSKDPKKMIGVANALFRGITLQSEGRHREALDWLQRAYREDPDNFSVLFQLADCLRQLGDSVTAIAYYKKAVAMNPAASEAVGHLAALTFQHGDVAGAFQLIERGLSHNPRSFALWMTAGDLELATGNASGASERYKRASEIEPMRVESWIGLAEAAHASRRNDEARAYYEKARAIDPRHPRLPAANQVGGRNS
jgi:tetratricopeptide (TPR) repeat protein